MGKDEKPPVVYDWGVDLVVQTESELTFEKYLESQNLSWERIASSSRKQPDYRVVRQPGISFFEVKEFNEPGIRPKGGFSPCPPIRKKIDRAAKQFKEYRSSPCALVLWNSKSILRSVYPEVVLSAAFGERCRASHSREKDLGADPPVLEFRGSAALTRGHNTTISAIVVLTTFRLDHLWLETWNRLNAMKQAGHEVTTADQFNILEGLASQTPRTYSYEGTLRAITLENPYARIAFPVDLFVGPFDQHWRMVNGWFEAVFLGSELTRLRARGVPFIFL